MPTALQNRNTRNAELNHQHFQKALVRRQVQTDLMNGLAHVDPVDGRHLTLDEAVARILDNQEVYLLRVAK